MSFIYVCVCLSVSNSSVLSVHPSIYLLSIIRLSVCLSSRDACLWVPLLSKPVTLPLAPLPNFSLPAPDHQPQECFGLLECLHNNMQVQTQIAQEQLALLQDIRESMTLLISQQNGELRGQLEQHPPRDPSPSPHLGS
uniref:TSSK6 activating cochaperone n=1 Tax=Laticauda laticaudata TaxID=8630 RepID=A0A8C5WT95_LATLA